MVTVNLHYMTSTCKFTSIAFCR